MTDLYIESGFKKLRCGYTTGSCAVAASKAATIMLYSNETLECIEIDTPKGISLNIKINSIKRERDSVTVSVIKDAGDDCDITNGIEVFVKAEKLKEGFKLIAGEGIGKVTKDGLFVKKGEPAINPVPRAEIERETSLVLPDNKGVKVTISIPKGVEIAKKTFNPRLGIEGGISILGTRGIVYPMSEDALKDSIKLEINQKAINREKLVLTFGNIGEKCALEQGFKEEEIVIISNFVGFALECCVNAKIKEAILIGHIGKISKIAYGCFNTHSRVCDVRLEVLALELTLLGAEKSIIEEVLKQKTSEGAVKFLGKGYEALYENIGKKIKTRAEGYTYNELEVQLLIYYGFSDYNILYNSLGD
ncbi:cobalt-precorrin-5B (C(1))-methyltransferase CbiD [Clostridium chauvoei]|uniref:Cobalt-precorrin-5B C(1)-methyltransferase n=2 Tax=Clostridium chauvoei TaxID=46867 RepID=S6EQH3_9CLOT|nr:cobalt-precorrin-5B (C(1))-methyltransferase CbiD [Clostridium chauvoei]ATD54830.1 cobalamin biosynthesis protein CbiD [Clostridium chauvoei]ATD57490.1 cobalamin biosynthesis protein CbiD [Clostridium chauvoei]MBX7281166.1 cobalt-precorrin-5B (C(1))-methyltransferase CbiD [Clostridium chauvoei]MBX7283658.1 cobalt-precorrin-5B (C(1))-methyltransferase CbiD [Clostridium chauvoei]MBX7286266.1 cobalt-precorrin-5B (C(1))-methyltransferase CbiD [Clostridium chauvoei]